MKTRSFVTCMLILALALLSSTAGTRAQGQPPPDVSAGAPPAAQRTAGIAGGESISGSFVVFDPSVGGDPCYLSGATQTFCFRAESFDPDWEIITRLWERFPADWTVSNVYLQGTPFCTNGGAFDPFSWSFGSSANEINIYHPRAQHPADHCVAYYCFNVTSGSGAPNAQVSWYWKGSGWESTPHYPCSNDGYTPTGQPACDEQIHPPAAIPPCALSPLALTPEQMDAGGCADQPRGYTLTVGNYAGYDMNVNLTYTVITGTATCSGPAQVSIANGNSLPIAVILTPQGQPGDTAACQVYAEDAANPANHDTSQIVERLFAGYFAPAGWRAQPIGNATPHYWAGGAVGTHPAAAGPVGYVVGGLASVSTLNPDLQMYDPATAAWTQLADMPNPRHSTVVGWIGGQLYAAGGFDASFAATNDLQVYNPATDTWDNVTPANLPNARGGGAGGVGTCASGAGQCLFHVGGGPSNAFPSTTLETWQYNPATNAWTQLDNKPAGSSPYGFLLGAGVGCMGHVYVGGDYRGYHEFYRLDATQPTGSQWTRLADIPATAGSMSPALVCKEDWGQIVLFGGDVDGNWGDVTDAVYVYDIASNTWEGPLPYRLSVSQLGSVGWHMGGRVWAVGGTYGTGPISPLPFESLAQVTCQPLSHSTYLPLTLRQSP